ncbi:MAG: outer membrane lipoprotein carrier protein LolA [Deltaproteobacteria bacterium]|nr:outer membrane lipoprotein carrier protein LolA [Deltaproteobacteria bacterium]
MRALASVALLALVAAASSPARADGDAGTPAPPSAPEREKLEGEKLDALLGDIAKARKGVKAMKASFTQERKLTLLATSVKSTGQMTFVAPDRLRWELAAPDDVIYWIGPEGLSYRTKSSSATVPQGGANVAKALADLRALLGGDLSGLKERYTLSGARGASDVEVAGAAKDPKASVKAFTLVLDKTMTLPVRATLLEGKKDSIEIVFSGAVANPTVDPATMRP